MGEGSLRNLRCLGGLVSTLVGCSAAPEGSVIEETATSTAGIKGGTAATAYPEAALVDLYANGKGVAFCSGSVIAPQVVLTAGHCVMGESGLIPDSWVVTAPYMKQSSKSSGSAVYDWQTTQGNVDPSKHDIGLIFLAKPFKISGSQCPVLATKKLPDSSNVLNIGRIDSGQLSHTDLFVSTNTPVQDGTQDGFPLAYAAQDYIEQGDSGGPDEVPGSSPHTIVAVNSGAGSKGELLARVDLLNNTSVDWIAKQIESHGGPCSGASTPLNTDGGISGATDIDGGAGSDSGEGDGAVSAWTSSSSSGGGCSVGLEPGGAARTLSLLGSLGCVLLARRRRAQGMRTQLAMQNER